MRLTLLVLCAILGLSFLPAPDTVFAQAEVFPAAADGKGLEQAKKDLGYEALTDRALLLNAALRLVIAIACGVVLSYHPWHFRRQKGIEELDQPKIIITYTVVGSLIGIVVGADPSMGLAIFGIGGLMRFRTELAAPRETGRVILATIIGIFCGLELWVIVLFATIIAWFLILVLDARVGYRMMVRGLESDVVGPAARAYRTILAQNEIVITQEKKNVNKKQVSFVFRAGRDFDKEALEDKCRAEIAENLRGTVDWPEEG